MQRIIILGGSGFMGQHLINMLDPESYQTIAIDLNPPPVYQPTRFIQGDAHDTELIANTVEPGDTVVHLAHMGIPAESNIDPAADVENNLPGYIRLLDALADHGIDRIIYSSTGGQIYGDQDSTPIPESVELNPISSYGIVKLAMEHYLRLAHRRRGLSYYILRIGNPYGPLQELSNRHGAVPVIMRCLIEDRAFQMFGSGKTVRDYIFIEDVARAIMSLIGSSLKEGTFNVGTGQGISLRELIQAVERVAGKKLKVEEQPLRDSDPGYNVLDCTLLGKATGWQPEIGLEQGLRMTWVKMNTHE